MSAAHVILYHFVEAFRRAKDYEGLIAQHASPLDGAIEQLGRRLYVLKQACLGFRSACETEGRVVFSADDTEWDRVVAAEVQSLGRLCCIYIDTMDLLLPPSHNYRPY